MDRDTIFTLLGTLAGIFVLVSYIYNSMKILRIINIFGSIIFVIYGIGIGAYPVAGLNAACTVVHIVRLVQGNKKVKDEVEVPAIEQETY